MFEDVAFVLSIILLGAAGSVLLKVIAAKTKSQSFQAFAALT